MNTAKVARWITSARFEPYLTETRGDHAAAVALYVWNTRISAAAFETLHHVEVLVRNSVDAQFVPVDPSAVPEETWLNDPSLLVGPADRVSLLPVEGDGHGRSLLAVAGYDNGGERIGQERRRP